MDPLEILFLFLIAFFAIVGGLVLIDNSRVLKKS